MVTVIVGKGPGATAIPLDLAPFTLVGATTRAGLLTGPLRDRFGFTAHMDFYEPAELARTLTFDVAHVNQPPGICPSGPPDIFLARLLDPTTLLHKAFVNPMLLPATFNEHAFWQAEVPAANGFATARSLARLYAATIGEVDGVRLLEPATLARATEQQSAGEDLVLGYETRYATGFQLSLPFQPMAGEGSFGHYGMGGSVGFAHPGHGFAFGYVMNQMGASGGVDARTKGLIDAVVDSLP